MKRPRPRHLLGATVVLVGTLLVGCSSGRGVRSDPFVAAGGSGEQLTIAVLNDNPAETRIALLTNGSRRELGSLFPQEVEIYEVPWSGLEQLRFEVREVAGDRYTTPYLTVRAGSRVDVVIQGDLRRTRIFRR